MQQPLRVLFVDDNNTSRSRMAEVILRAQAGDDFQVASAGVQPERLDPHTGELLQQFTMQAGDENGTPVERYAEQPFDFVIVLRDERAGEPELNFTSPGNRLTWDVPDPVVAAAGEDEEARDRTYRRIFELLRQRIQVFVLAQHDELRDRGSDHVVGAHQPTDLPMLQQAEVDRTPDSNPAHE